MAPLADADRRHPPPGDVDGAHRAVLVEPPARGQEGAAQRHDQGAIVDLVVVRAQQGSRQRRVKVGLATARLDAAQPLERDPQLALIVIVEA